MLLFSIFVCECVCMGWGKGRQDACQVCVSLSILSGDYAFCRMFDKISPVFSLKFYSTNKLYIKGCLSK